MTSRAAKAEYKKHGPRLSTQEFRTLERTIELEQRADRIRGAEQRRRDAKRKRLAKEAREREARHRMRIPSPRPAVPRSQILLEGFVVRVKDTERGEPWTDDGLDDAALASAMLGPRPEGERSTMRASGGVRLSVELLEAWDGFLASDTQIEREITLERTAEESPCPRAGPLPTHFDSFLSCLSTQDVSITEDDLEELGVGRTDPVGEHDVSLPADQLADRVADLGVVPKHPPQPPPSLGSKAASDRALVPHKPLPAIKPASNEINAATPPTRSPSLAVSRTTDVIGDRQLMPPPLTSTSRKMAPCPPRPVATLMHGSPQAIDMWLGDFGLSTQELCEVDF